MCFCGFYDSPVGRLTLVSDESSIIGLWLEKQRFYMDVLQGQPCAEKESEAIRLAKRWLDRYFNGKKPNINEVPIKLIGSNFRLDVWKRLLEIPYGEVITYGKLAREIARAKGIDAMSAQAVGCAVGHNPISILVPCHRVVGANGSLTGYSGGLQAKRELLTMEGVDMAQFRNLKKIQSRK